MVNNEGINVISKIVEAEQKSQKLHDSILNKLPCYEKCVESKLLSSKDFELLKKFHELPKKKKFEFFAENEDLVVILLSCLCPDLNVHLIQYVLTVWFENIRNDGSCYSYILEVLRKHEKHKELYETLRVLCVHGDTYIPDKAAFLLSGFFCYNSHNTFRDSEIRDFISNIDKLNVTEEGKMDIYINILKIDKYRKDIYALDHFLSLIKKNLDINNKCASMQYKSVFCVWLLTFKDYFIKKLYRNGIITLIINLFKKNRVEKIVRVCLNIIKNVYCVDECFEIIVENNIIQTLTVLEYDKWRDNDIYDSIMQLLNKLEQRVKNFSSFERYCVELSNGKLKWSVLHTEKFWMENVMQFEKDEFKAIQQLSEIIREYARNSLTEGLKEGNEMSGSNSSVNQKIPSNNTSTSVDVGNSKVDSTKGKHIVDSVTVAVACFDIGEFARLYPNGKKICQNFKIKENVMILITAKNREVAREALLCAQKIMLNNWQSVSNVK